MKKVAKFVSKADYSTLTNKSKRQKHLLFGRCFGVVILAITFGDGSFCATTWRRNPRIVHGVRCRRIAPVQRRIIVNAMMFHVCLFVLFNFRSLVLRQQLIRLALSTIFTLVWFLFHWLLTKITKFNRKNNLQFITGTEKPAKIRLNCLFTCDFRQKNNSISLVRSVIFSFVGT